MKKLKTLSLTIVLILTSAIICTSAVIIVREVNETKSATIEKTNGLYIFINSKPAQEYEELGEVKTPGIVVSVKAGPMLDILISKTNKNYKTADGIICNTENNFEKAKVIKFK